ncbi:4-substituted benzoates-glutamate ligase GH3.12-like isoform X2 [Raphanus sativus]|nr:4-substituted benzoates-glutamate ligase GH3.12-like isoform X2 [Raphanus sativus]
MNLKSELNDLEELTSNAKQIQDDMLEEILRVSANTEYLRPFLHGSSHKELFKKNVPVVTYEDVKPYIERVANGEPSDVISGEPITHFFRSSGTTGGKQKIFPVNNKYYQKRIFSEDLRCSILSKHINGVVDGKVIAFLNTRKLSRTPSGLPVGPVITSFLVSEYFKNWSSKRYTSPDEVISCTDSKQSTYCHFLCALVQREEVVSIFVPFACALVQAIKFLETHWKDLCNDIRSGHVSEWITDLGCRDSVSVMLGVPNPELADQIERECCRQTSWEGIITRLWPNIKFIHSVVTGQMSQFIPVLEFYSNKLPLVSMSYSASETLLGINVNPLCKPQDVSYTFLPNMSYFEFLPLDEGNNAEVVDLVDVKLGHFYDPLVTNHFGLYRYRMGDILQVTGFYNKTPQFRFVRRKDTVISVHVEKTTEEDIANAMNRVTAVLDSEGLILMGFTCKPDISTFPGHYVFYLELKAKNSDSIVKLDNSVMVKCCCVMEKSFNALYRKFRREYESIGALEIRVTKQGRFDSLMEYFISQGASASQYKTPLCIKSPQGLAILEDRVIAQFFSDKSPPL